MEKSCERISEHKQDSKTYGCMERTFSTLSVDDVYEIAKLIGSEVEKLIDGYGKESAEGLVPKIVKVLELLECFAARNHAQKSKEEELLKAFETLQVQQQKKQRGTKECEEGNNTEMRVRRASMVAKELANPFNIAYSLPPYAVYVVCATIKLGVSVNYTLNMI